MNDVKSMMSDARKISAAFLQHRKSQLTSKSLPTHPRLISLFAFSPAEPCELTGMPEFLRCSLPRKKRIRQTAAIVFPFLILTQLTQNSKSGDSRCVK